MCVCVCVCVCLLTVLQPMSRKNELRRLLLAEAPVLRDVLTRVLTSQLAKVDVAQPPAPDAAREAILKGVIGACKNLRGIETVVRQRHLEPRTLYVTADSPA